MEDMLGLESKRNLKGKSHSVKRMPSRQKGQGKAGLTIDFCHDISYNLIIVRDGQGLSGKEKTIWRY